MSIKVKNLSEINGKEVKKFTIKNGKYCVELINFGAAITSIIVPNANGGKTDVVLGYDSLADYQENNPYIGVTVGRFCNRIAKGKFALNNKEFVLAINNGQNSLHGGIKGFSHQIWDAEILDENSIKMTYLSKDGEEGFPGELITTITFSLSIDGKITLEYFAKSNKDTVINLTNHTYFNLTGCGLILDEKLKINSNSFLPTDSTNIPTGEICDVQNTPFDFTKFKRIGKDINDKKSEQIKIGSGFDHSYVLDGDINKVAAEAFSEVTGIKLNLFTTQPAVQLYSGNWLNNTIGKKRKIYANRSGFCLETQHYPNSPNEPKFPSTILKKDEIFQSKTIYQFSTK